VIPGVNAAMIRCPSKRAEGRGSGVEYRACRLLHSESNFMDRKSIIVVVACGIMLVVWQFVIVPKYWPYKPAPPSATNTMQPSQSAGQTNAPAVPVTSSTSISTPRLAVNTNVQEELLVVTNEDA